MSSLISEAKPLSGMMISGYTLSMATEEGRVHYGMFESVDAAKKWVGDLDGYATIFPIYAPVWNRG